jgi:glycosyltransferase 2 family protein
VTPSGPDPYRPENDAPPGVGVGARRFRALSWVLLSMVAAFVILALNRNWAEVAADLEALDWEDLVLSGLAGAVGSVFFCLSWRLILDDIEHRLPLAPAFSMFFIGQLGKYVPGSVWTAAIQADMGRKRGMRAAAIVLAYGVALIVSIATGAVVGSLVLLGVGGEAQRPMLGLVLAAAAVITFPLVRPRLVNRVLAWAARKVGRTVPMLDLSGRTLAGSGLLSIIAWLFLGLHVWLIARPLGAVLGDLPAASGAFALALVAGLLVVPLPAGAGVREGILIATLAPMIGAQAALTVSLVSRFLLLLGDVALALLFAGPSLVRGVGRGRAT